jgi:AbrB family looped-hinge helix DNA binding protein
MYFIFSIMSQVVSITSQGQVTIPAKIRKLLGLVGSVKAVISLVDNKLVIEPKADFWSLAGGLKPKVTLSDKKLDEARSAFGKQWGKV